MVTCSSCGREIGTPANFCPFCGARLELAEATSVLRLDDPTLMVELGADVEEAVEALPAGSALLLVEKGPNQGARYLLKVDRVSAGRSKDADILLDDISVSRHHAEFIRTPAADAQGREYAVEDRGSLNGTYVNKMLITARTPLRQGDVVQIGKFRMVFLMGPRGIG